MDAIKTTTIKVVIQENGIIRRADNGLLIGRLTDYTEFEKLQPEQPEPAFGAFVLKRAKDGTPTKVEIQGKEYALIPPPVGKGKGKK